MKNEDLILLAVVAMGVFVILPKMLKKTTSATAPGAGPTSSSYATEIMRADGWTYYTDGTSIDPNGRYYKGSDLVYNPAGMYQ